MNIFKETLYGDHGQSLAVDSVLHEGSTAFQEVLIFANPTFGKVLVLDGVVQFTELDNHVYHEMIAHVPLTACADPKDVLIIGGGDGGTLKEVLKYPVTSAVLVELDSEVIALSQRFFPEMSGDAFVDPRVSVVIGDGAGYVARTSRRFDVIIIDSTDPVGPGETLFSDEHYRHCRTVLRPGGVISVQSGVPFYRRDELDLALARLTRSFGAAQAYLAPVPTYAHGTLALMVAAASDIFVPPFSILNDRFGGIETAYYSPDVHRAAFVAPPSFKTIPDASSDGTEVETLPDWIAQPAQRDRR